MAQMENTAEVICSLPDLREEKVLASFLLRLVAQYPKHESPTVFKTRYMPEKYIGCYRINIIEMFQNKLI